MNTLLITITALLLSSGIQIYGLCRTTHFRMWETAPGSLLFDFDIPTGWRKVRGPVYIGAGIVIQLVGGIASLLMQ